MKFQLLLEIDTELLSEEELRNGITAAECAQKAVSALKCVTKVTIQNGEGFLHNRIWKAEVNEFNCLSWRYCKGNR